MCTSHNAIAYVDTATTNTLKNKRTSSLMMLSFWIPSLIVTSSDAHFVSTRLPLRWGLCRFQAQVGVGLVGKWCFGQLNKSMYCLRVRFNMHKMTFRVIQHIKHGQYG